MAESDKVPLKCRYCPEIFPNLNQLKNHVRDGHSDISRRTPRREQKCRVGSGTVRATPRKDDMVGSAVNPWFDSNDDEWVRQSFLDPSASDGQEEECWGTD